MISTLVRSSCPARPALRRAVAKPAYFIVGSRAAPSLAATADLQNANVSPLFNPEHFGIRKAQETQGFDASQIKEKSKRFKLGVRGQLSRCLAELQALPLTLSEGAGVREILGFYETALAELASYEKRRSTIQSDIAFIRRLEAALKRDAEVTFAILAGVRSVMAEMGNDYDSVRPVVDENLMHIFRSRIELRMSLRQHLASLQGSRSGFHGMYEFRCSAKKVSETARQHAMAICEAQLGESPEIIVTDDSISTFTCAPALLQYTLTEVFKNACKAVMERHGDSSERPVPPIRCSINYSEDDVHIVVSDSGAGIPKERVDKIWQFLYTTSTTSQWSYGTFACGQSPWSSESSGASQCTSEAIPGYGTGVLSGYGIGLKMSRLYAQLFGGDLAISSTYGVGTDVTIRLSRRGMALDMFDESVNAPRPICTSQHP